MFFVKCLFLFCFSGISLFFIFTFLRFLFFVFFSVFFFIHLRWFFEASVFFRFVYNFSNLFFICVNEFSEKKIFCFCDLKKKISCSKKSFHVKKGLKNGEKVRTDQPNTFNGSFFVVGRRQWAPKNYFLNN